MTEQTATIRTPADWARRFVDRPEADSTDWDAIGSLLHDDCVYTANGDERWDVRGSAGILDRWRAIRDAFPDMRAQIVNLVEGTDTVAFELHVVETHTGDFVLPWTTIAPTGAKFDEVMAYIVTIDRDGKAVRIAHYFDSGPVIRAVMGIHTSPR